jgi:hypothetical protein
MTSAWNGALFDDKSIPESFFTINLKIAMEVNGNIVI